MSDTNAMWDIYGNMYGDGWSDATAPINLNININTANTNTNINWPTMSSIISPTWLGTAVINYNPLTLDPNAATITPELLNSLFDKMVTVVKPGEKVVLCFDIDVTSEQCREVAEIAKTRGIDGIVIQGARAGTGFKGNGQSFTEEEKRVDILARIGELWALAPELKLTDLLEWWGGEEMEDTDFAAAVETYFMKVTNGYRGKP